MKTLLSVKPQHAQSSNPTQHHLNKEIIIPEAFPSVFFLIQFQREKIDENNGLICLILSQLCRV